jgi:hypothetical protein
LTGAALALAFVRFYSPFAACAALAVVAGNRLLFDSMFNGLETPFVVALAAALFLAAHQPDPRWCGAVLGALVANKLDGALAAVAYALVVALLTRRAPLRAAATALLVFLPMAAWLVVRFGSFVPNSMLVKLSGHASERFSWTWVLGKLRWNAFWPLCLSATVVAAPLRRRGEELVPAAVIATWLVLHVAAYSTIDLGAPYTWYVAPCVVMLAILAGVGLDACLHVAARAWARLRDAGDGGRSFARRLGGIAAVVALVVAGAAWLRTRAGADELPAYTRGDLARLCAGAWLRLHADPDEVLMTPFGLPAFAYGGPVLDLSGLNSAPDSPLRGRETYAVLEGEHVPAGGGWELVASFRFEEPGDARSARGGAKPYRVFARERSRVQRERVGYGVPGRNETALRVRDVPLASRAWARYLALALERDADAR